MRIVGGIWRGRALIAPPGHTTRPTADRLRQALFDMLIHAPWGGPEVLEGAMVLDAFAGTGALGLEALSRGAARAVFIEKDPAALAALRANVAACGAGAMVRVVAGDALQPPAAVEACGLVLLDPPYATGACEPLPPTPSRKGRGRFEPFRAASPPLAGGVRGGGETRQLARALAALTNVGWITPGALIAAETARAAPSPAPVPPLAERIHGAGRITVWRAGSEMAPAG